MKPAKKKNAAAPRPRRISPVIGELVRTFVAQRRFVKEVELQIGRLNRTTARQVAGLAVAKLEEDFRRIGDKLDKVASQLGYLEEALNLLVHRHSEFLDKTLREAGRKIGKRP